MKTPRELILEHHRSAERALMAIRGEDLAAAVNASHWRGRILEAATPALVWWRQWLWPCPRAWAGLAAAWVVILLLNVTTPDPRPRLARNSSPVTFQSLALLQQKTHEFTQSLGPADDQPAVPPPAPPTPRSDRPRKQLIG
jgi:hypothetical protein